MIQLDWIFLQRVTKNTVYVFAGVDNMLQENFLTCLLFGNLNYLSTSLGTISTMPVNKTSLGLLNPMASTNFKYLHLQGASTDLIRSVKVEGEFSNANSLVALRE